MTLKPTEAEIFAGEISADETDPLKEFATDTDFDNDNVPGPRPDTSQFGPFGYLMMFGTIFTFEMVETTGPHPIPPG